MYVILKQEGLGRGGLNFDAHLRRGSTDLEDLFIAHVGAMDAFARGLQIAAGLIEDRVLTDFLAARYGSYDKGIGKRIEAQSISFNELEAFVLENDEPQPVSGKQEMLENTINQYLMGGGK